MNSTPFEFMWDVIQKGALQSTYQRPYKVISRTEKNCHRVK